jgi:hypothetical protein
MKDNQQRLLAILAENAESIISSRRPDTCRLILCAAEMVPESPYRDQPGMFVGAGKALATHYVVALIWGGFRRNEDNGFEVYCLPKRQMSEDGFGTCSMFIRITACSLADSLYKKPLTPRASSISLLPCSPRLLPAGAKVAGWV